MKALLAGSALLLATAGTPGFAACVHNGVHYEAGAKLCFDGWLQECTVADFWKAIGMCKMPDFEPPLVERRDLRETLIAKALGERDAAVASPVQVTIR